MDIPDSSTSTRQNNYISPEAPSEPSDPDEKPADVIGKQVNIRKSPVESGAKVIDVSDPIDALSSNREQTRVVAAGSRGVLKIFRVTDNSLDHVQDLRPAKSRRMSLLYSPSNVAWSKLKDEYVATTSTTGAVVLWNVEKTKIETSYKVHTRSATVVRFHRKDANLMISGSKDATMLLYDFRQPQPTQCFKTGIHESVRDIAFCAQDGREDYFLSADDGGVVKVWDVRNHEQAVNSFKPHTGYVSSIALNPAEPNLIASGGGRDKLIKVWNWNDPEKSERFRPLFQVETIAPVGRVYWRPDHRWQIASCAVVNDMSLLVWDIRRPHLPVVSFSGHRDSVTDLWWSKEHPSRFVSSGKDGLLVLHQLANGEHSLNHLCDSQIDVAPDGLLAITLSCDNELKHAPKWDNQRATLQLKMDKKGRPPSSRQRQAIVASRRQAMYDPFRGPIHSDIALGVPDTAENALSPALFAQFAQDFIIGGMPLQELCAHNAFAATMRGDERRAQTWRHVGILLSFTDFQKTYVKEYEELIAKDERKWNIYIQEQENQNKTPLLFPKPLPEIPMCLLSENKVRRWWPRAPVVSADSARDPIEFLRTIFDHLLDKNVELKVEELESEEPKWDEFAGLPWEVFTERRAMADSPTKAVFDPEDGWVVPAGRADWEPAKILKRTLSYLAAQGDMQMCAVIATVVGHRLSETVSNFHVEAWLHSYIEMLDRLELFASIAALYKWSWIRRLQTKTTEGTYLKERVTHVVALSDPDANAQPLVKEKVVCCGPLKNGRCEVCISSIEPVCVICDTVISGQIWSCQKCNHNMHVDHAVAWFRREYETVYSSESSEDSEDDFSRRSDATALGDEPSLKIPPEHDSGVCVEQFELEGEGKFGRYRRRRRIEDRSNNTCPVEWCDCFCNVEHNEDFDRSLFDKKEVQSVSTTSTLKMEERADAIIKGTEIYSHSTTYDIGLSGEDAGRLDAISTGLLDQNNPESRLLHNAFLASKVVDAPLRDSWCNFFDTQCGESSDTDIDCDTHIRKRLEQQIQLDMWEERAIPDESHSTENRGDVEEGEKLLSPRSISSPEETEDDGEEENMGDTEESNDEFGGILRPEKRNRKMFRNRIRKVNNALFESILGDQICDLSEASRKIEKSSLIVRRRSRPFTMLGDPSEFVFPTVDPVPVDLIWTSLREKRDLVIAAARAASAANGQPSPRQAEPTTDFQI